MEIADILIKFALIVVIFLISLVIAMYSTYAERKVAAFFQDRIGPNRAGPFGILQPFADGAKMFPERRDHSDECKHIFIHCRPFIGHY